jgi:ubiquitin C-terminal hydrolase
MPEEWSVPPAGPSPSSAPAKPALKSPWGTVQTPSKRKYRRGWVQRQPLETMIASLSLEARPAMFLPRGLHNSDRKCFLNTTIQTLISVPFFYNLLKKLARCKFTESQCPVLHRLVRLYKEFEPVSQASREALLAGKPVSLPLGAKLEPIYFYELLKTFNPIASDWQEDMQEFLCFVLDRAHSELVDVAALLEIGDLDENRLNVADEWSTVGKNNKSAVVVTDVSKFKQSAISHIFSGELQSVVKRKNAKHSMALEPFFCLHLDIAQDSVSTLEDALNLHFSAERLDDANGTSKETAIKSLPPVLLVHLKRFAFLNGKSEKITKPIFYPEHLSMKSKWLGSNFTIGREYSLHAVTQHLGPRAHGGHYTSFVKVCNGDWLLFDDASIEKVDLNHVLDSANGYVLCYVRK